MSHIDVIELTQKLISFDTVNPPGNEEVIAEFLGKLLSENDFSVEYTQFAQGRLHLVAEKGISDDLPPLVLSGHLDTVATGAKKWHYNPFAGIIKDGKIYGRGASDMKSALAAMILASKEAYEEGIPRRGVRLVLTACEETGCQGVHHLIKNSKKIGDAFAIIVGEPTANKPFIGHKGALFLNVIISGKTAHSSMPELGENAIYKAATAVLKVENFRFNVDKDPYLGFPTINIGKISGGNSVNSVPDRTEFTIDVRSTTKLKHFDLIKRLSEELGKETFIEVIADNEAMLTSENDPFVRLIYDVCNFYPETSDECNTLPYLTDGSALQKFYGGKPVIILGPGEPGMAHQTDEYCFIDSIYQSVGIYKNILLRS